MDIEQEMQILQGIEAKYDALIRAYTEIRTLRDQFAMAALSAMNNWRDADSAFFPDAARDCYAMADAMLKQRSRQ